MSACDDKDPVPCKTQAELDTEETLASEAEEENERHPLVSWGLTIAGVVVLVGMLAKACLAP